MFYTKKQEYEEEILKLRQLVTNYLNAIDNLQRTLHDERLEYKFLEEKHKQLKNQYKKLNYKWNKLKAYNLWSLMHKMKNEDEHYIIPKNEYFRDQNERKKNGKV